VKPTANKELTRRSFLKGSLLTGGLLVASGVGYRLVSDAAGRHSDLPRSESLLASVSPGDVPDGLPNIIIIFTDDLGYGEQAKRHLPMRPSTTARVGVSWVSAMANGSTFLVT